MKFSFTHYNIANTLIKSQNIEIKGIFEKSKQSKYTQFYNLQKNNSKFRNLIQLTLIPF